MERGRGNSLKQTYVEGGRGLHVKRTGMNRVGGGGGAGQKLEVSGERAF